MLTALLTQLSVSIRHLLTDAGRIVTQGTMNMNSSQDWEPVVLRKSKPKAGTVNKDKVVNEALRTGGQVIV